MAYDGIRIDGYDAQFKSELNLCECAIEMQ